MAVVLCAYSSARWSSLCEAVASVREQTPAPREIVIVVDHNAELLSRACAAFTGARCMANDGRKGLSGARNTGVRNASTDIVAFIDDDARAQPGWLGALVAAYADPAVVGTGGTVWARWSQPRPRWFPAEFEWVVGCSYRGGPTTDVEIRNPIGANMSFRRQAFQATGGFSHLLGRVGRTPLGCEETEFAIRARTATGGSIVHIPSASVDHLVTPERATWRYFRKRCWAEGVSKAIVATRVGTGRALSAERSYVGRVLPAGVARGVIDAMTGDGAGILRAGAIVTGFSLTCAGYVAGRARSPFVRRGE